MLLFALWFQDKQCVKFNLLLVSTLIKFPLNIFVFKRHDFIPCFLAKNVLLLNNYKVVAIFKYQQTIYYKR